MRTLSPGVTWVIVDVNSHNTISELCYPGRPPDLRKPPHSQSFTQKRESPCCQGVWNDNVASGLWGEGEDMYVLMYVTRTRMNEHTEATGGHRVSPLTLRHLRFETGSDWAG